jgi:hypothetical protein
VRLVRIDSHRVVRSEFGLARLGSERQFALDDGGNLFVLPPERDAFVEAARASEDAPAVRPLDPGESLVV